VAAAESAPGSWRAVSGLWLGGLRVHQGRASEGVALIRPGIVKDAVAAQAHPLAHANLFAALGLAQLGRADEALAAVQEFDRANAPDRWAGRAANVRGWILRNLGESAAADESNAAALAEASAVGMVEAISHAHLDLAAGLLRGGDLDRATVRVEASLALGDGHALAWRHRMRARLYQGEIALGRGDAEAAIASAREIEHQATEMGVLRYVTLAELLESRARLGSGEPVDLDGIQTALDLLTEVAGLEAWWLTASLAQAAGVDAWMTLAERRVAELAGHAGPYAGTLGRTAERMLERMRITGRNG
jgi:tetratricopeptide (TPR) repeat protein